MSSTSNGCEKPTYGPARMEQQVSMVSRPGTMRRTSRQTFGTSWSASNPGTIKRHRYAEPTSPSLTRIMHLIQFAFGMMDEDARSLLSIFEDVYQRRC